MIDDARSPFEFCLCDRVGYRRGGMALVSVRLCRLDIQALIHMGDAADRFRGDWRDGLSTRILRTIAWLGECRGWRFAAFPMRTGCQEGELQLASTWLWIFKRRARLRLENSVLDRAWKAVSERKLCKASLIAQGPNQGRNYGVVQVPAGSPLPSVPMAALWR